MQPAAHSKQSLDEWRELSDGAGRMDDTFRSKVSDFCRKTLSRCTSFSNILRPAASSATERANCSPELGREFGINAPTMHKGQNTHNFLDS